MFPFIFFANLQQKPIALNPFIISLPEVASLSLSSCDHIASQLSPEPAYPFDIVDCCCLGLRSLDHDSFLTSLATTSHSPSLSFSSSQMPPGSICDLLCFLSLPSPKWAPQATFLEIPSMHPWILHLYLYHPSTLNPPIPLLCLVDISWMLQDISNALLKCSCLVTIIFSDV